MSGKQENAHTPVQGRLARLPRRQSTLQPSHPSCTPSLAQHTDTALAEEIRRSGRATKGQHTKNSDDDLAAPAPAAKPKELPKSKGRSKGGKKEPSPEEADENAIIRCVCGENDDDYEGTMVCCETCQAWQHNLCMGISENSDELPEYYWCERCKPENHIELNKAIKRGEKPWEERKRQKAEDERLKKQKKGKRKVRPSGGVEKASVDDAKSTPASSETGNKRKFDALDTSNGQKQVSTRHNPASDVVSTNRTHQVSPSISSPTVLVPATSQRRKSSAITNEAKRRKSGNESAPTQPDSKAHAATSLAGNISDLSTGRQSAANALAKEIKGLVEKSSKNGTYRIPDGETATSVSTRYALQIEHALETVHKETTPGYNAQFRAILFNIKKNLQLLARILSGSLSALELAEMSTDDMASEELQRQRAIIKEEADKQAVLISEQSGPRIRKTHKGEEMIGEDTGATELANYTAAPVRRRDTIDENTAHTPPEGPSSPHAVELPDDVGKPPLSVDTSATQPRRQSTFDMKEVWKHAHSPDAAHSATHPPRRSTGGDYDTPSQNMVQDADVDRLLKDEDMDDVPASPSADGSWKGKVDMAGVAAFRGSARWVAGGDVAQKIPYKELLPRILQISGRIQVQRADEYVSGMRYSQTSDVCSLAITPRHTQEDVEGFQAIFEYFHSKQRWGVIPSETVHEAIRDLYVVTLEAGATPYPSFLNMLEAKEIEEPRPQNMLLLTLVVKTRSPPPSNTGTPLQQAHQGNPQFSPTIPQNGATVPPVASEIAIKTLGPFINTTVVKQILEAVPDMGEMQLRNLRDVLEREPGTRDDIGKLGEHLAERNRISSGVVA
jgi:hypothetical protein